MVSICLTLTSGRANPKPASYWYEVPKDSVTHQKTTALVAPNERFSATAIDAFRERRAEILGEEKDRHT